MTVEDVGVWVCAIARADGAADRTTGLRGVAEEPVRTVFGKDLVAAVGTVSLDEFGAPRLTPNHEDRDWLAAKARAHNAVVSAIGGAAVPGRMATIYRDDWRVCQLLLKEQDDIEMALRRVSGRQELNVTANFDPKTQAIQDNSIRSQSADSVPRVGSLLRRRRQLAAQQRGYRLPAAEVDKVHAAVMRSAVDAKRTPVDDPRPAESGPWTLFSGTYLVEGAAVDQFMETVTALEQSTANQTRSEGAVAAVLVRR